MDASSRLDGFIYRGRYLALTRLMQLDHIRAASGSKERAAVTLFGLATKETGPVFPLSFPSITFRRYNPCGDLQTGGESELDQGIVKLFGVQQVSGSVEHHTERPVRQRGSVR